MDWASLVADKSTSGSIKSWANSTEIDSASVLENAQSLIFQTLRVREMKAEFDPLSLVAGNKSKALPSGFLDPIALFDVTNNIEMKNRHETWIQRHRMYDTDGSLLPGTPSDYGIFTEALQFPLAYDAAATLILIGFKRPALLGAGNTTNFLTDRFPHVLQSACNVYAFKFRNNDERMNTELQTLAALIQKTNAESDLTYRDLHTDNRVA